MNCDNFMLSTTPDKKQYHLQEIIRIWIRVNHLITY